MCLILFSTYTLTTGISVASTATVEEELLEEDDNKVLECVCLPLTTPSVMTQPSVAHTLVAVLEYYAFGRQTQ